MELAREIIDVVDHVYHEASLAEIQDTFQNVYAGAHYNYGLLLAAINQNDGAMEQFKITISVNADDVCARNNYGILLLMADRTYEAQEQLKTAIGIDPEYATTHVNYGKILMEKPGGFEKGFYHVSQAILLGTMPRRGEEVIGWFVGKEDALETVARDTTKTVEVRGCALAVLFVITLNRGMEILTLFQRGVGEGDSERVAEVCMEILNMWKDLVG